MGFEISDMGVQILSLLLTGLMILGKSLNLSESEIITLVKLFGFKGLIHGKGDK